MIPNCLTSHRGSGDHTGCILSHLAPLRKDLCVRHDATDLFGRVAVRLVLILTLSLEGHAELAKYEYSADAMGGAFSIVLFSDNRESADAAAAAAFSELRRLDHMLSNYLPDSQWSEINQHAADGAVKVSQELFDLLATCQEFSRQSEGAFDITVGPLIKAWGFFDGSGKFVDRPVVEEARELVGYGLILLDATNCTVRFARSGVELDPGGIGKGYAVDRMIGSLKRQGTVRALVSAAGSSIFAMGTPPDQSGWPVILRDPTDPKGNLGKILLKDESLSTSGCSRKFFRANGQVYCHIMDPRTGYPPRGVLQVSLVAPKALQSEAWTKAVFVNGRRWSTQHIPSGCRVLFCEEQSGDVTCSWLP
jgi:FAD:protein FMN transferase